MMSRQIQIVKCTIVIFFSFLWIKVGAQVSVEALIGVYNKNNLTEAKKALQTMPNFRLTDSLMADSLLGDLDEGKIKAYMRHNKTSLEFLFTNEALYKTFYKQAEKKFKYTTDYTRGSRNGFLRHTTSFSNYEGAKIGSLEVMLVVVRSTQTGKVAGYELLLSPYYDD